MRGANRYQNRRDRTQLVGSTPNGNVPGCALVRHSPFGQRGGLNLVRVPHVALRRLPHAAT